MHNIFLRILTSLVYALGERFSHSGSILYIYQALPWIQANSSVNNPANLVFGLRRARVISPGIS